MHLLLDYSQTNRHLKIQNTFSTKKHPIYYTYDPKTHQTYLTKVIYNKDDPRVINYYKHHIHNNILPYLKNKKQLKNASILTVPIENAQVIVKIDQEERIRKENIVKKKIKEVALLLKTYQLYRHNKVFEQQLNQIQQFMGRLSFSQNDIKYHIQSIIDSVSSISQLLTFINETGLTQNDAVQKIQSLSPTQQEQQQQEGFRTAMLLIDKYKSRQGMFNQKDLKANQFSQIKKVIETLSNYLSNTVYNLKQINQTQKTNQNNQVEQLYHQLIQYQQQLQTQQNTIYESNVLFITRKFIKGKTLREMILNKDERLTPKFCFDLTKSIVDFIFMNGGVKDLFITTENIIVDDCGTFHLNYFSFVGIEFIKLDKFVPKSDFQEILPYIHYKYLENDKPSKEFDIKILFRFIIVNFVSAFFKRDFIFDPKEIDFQIEVRNESSVQDQVDQIQKKLMGRAITKQQKNSIKHQFDNIFKVQFAQLVQIVFNRDKKQVNLSWEYIFSKLSKSNNLSRMVLSQDRNFTNILDIGKNINCLNHSAEFITDLFQIIDVSIMQAIDHYGHILGLICQNNMELGKMSGKNQERVTNIAATLQYQRNYFIKREWYSKEIFIPVKMQMSYTQILNYINWVHMLHSQTEPNNQTVKAVESLLFFLLEVEEIMKIIEPLITESIIQKSLGQGLRLYSKRQGSLKQTTYYSILDQYDSMNRKKKSNQSKQDDGDGFILESSEQEDDEEGQTLKKNFWNCFFSTIIIVYNLIKKFYIRINQMTINGEIKINSHKYTKLLQEFKPEIPPITTIR